MEIFGIGFGELVLILVLVLIIWGPNRIPEIARTIGKTVRALRKASSDLTATITARAFRGASYLYTLKLESGSELLSLVHSHHDHAIGEQLGIRLEIDHLVVFPGSQAGKS